MEDRVTIQKAHVEDVSHAYAFALELSTVATRIEKEYAEIESKEDLKIPGKTAYDEDDKGRR